MARPGNPRGAGILYRGVKIRLYPRTDGWKATFKLHGQKRRECYRPTQAAAQQAAQDAIANELDPTVAADGRDEEVARNLLTSHGVSLTEAARFWLSKHAKPLIEATVEQLRERWLAVREKNAGYHHAKALRGRTLHFEEAFHGRKIASLSLQDLIEWQDTLETKLSGRTVRNIHDATKMLFKFARKRGYLESDRLSAMEIVDRPKARPGKKEIYTPEQMQLLLDAAWALASPAAPAMAIGAFTAIRSEELYSHKCTQIFHDSKRLQMTRLLILRGKIKKGSCGVLCNLHGGGFDSRLGHLPMDSMILKMQIWHKNSKSIQ